jgi:hypothetical protein
MENFWQYTEYCLLGSNAVCNPFKDNRRFGGTYHLHLLLCLSLASTLVSFSAYYSTLKTEVICSSETSVEFQRTTWRYIPKTELFITTSVRTSNPTQTVGSMFRWRFEGGISRIQVRSVTAQPAKCRIRDEDPKWKTEDVVMCCMVRAMNTSGWGGGRQYVFCEAGTESLNIIQTNFRLENVTHTQRLNSYPNRSFKILLSKAHFRVDLERTESSSHIHFLIV